MSFCTECLSQFKLVKRVVVNFSTQGKHRHGNLFVCNCKTRAEIIDYFDDFDCTGSCKTDYTLKI